MVNLNPNRADGQYSIPGKFNFDEDRKLLSLIYLYLKRQTPRQSVYLQRFLSHIANLAENVNIFKDNHNYENYQERDSRCACCK